MEGKTRKGRQVMKFSITIGSASVDGQSRNRRREGAVDGKSIRKGSSEDEGSFYRCVVVDLSSVRNMPSSVRP